MQFVETSIPGVVVVDIEKLEDKRGFFARTWCAREFEEHGLAVGMVQASIALNLKKGTLRGIHFQAPPRREVRLVRCTAGAAFVVVVDLRPGRVSFRKSLDFMLTAPNRRAVYVPPGVGLGYQTMEDNTEIFYQMSAYFDPSGAAGFRWNDPAFAIQWPEDRRTILERDNAYPDFDESRVAGFANY
jgi:dTDP-4-dehydrorhamnose 3,5-epimerase